MDLNSLLFQVASVSGALFLFAALLIGAITRITDSQGGRGEAMMITCIIAAILCGGAAAFIMTQDLSMTF